MQSYRALRSFASLCTALAIFANVAVARTSPATDTPLRLPRIFATGMVLQREQRIPVWGWSAPRAAIAVALAGQVARATSNERGEWRVELAPRPSGGPYTLSVSSGDARLQLNDILVGDVWVASGQSNMEFELRQAKDASRQIAAAHDSNIRQFKVPTSWSFTPETDVTGGTWTPADPQHAGNFSAVAYFFAQGLRPTVKVPIGIINTTWGGSAIETWMSRKAHGFTDSAWTSIMREHDNHAAAAREKLSARIGPLPTADAGLVNGKGLWADPLLDDSQWGTMPVPAYWEGNGYPDMDGIAWYRTSFTLTDAEARGPVTLDMVAIDDDDITWVNGVEVGRTNGYNVPRHYVLPAGSLHAGINVLAVRVADGGGGGGINASVTLSTSGAAARSLAGTWKFKVGEVSFKEDGQQINKVPSVLYNRMVHPLLPFPIKGVIWYQGESNANDMKQASAYRAQFASLISSWRAEWGHGSTPLPFLWVQLPNYGKPDPAPPSSSVWATQRESMSASLTTARTGQAIAIDVGDAENLHPTNKQDVGARLALVGRKVAYGEKVVASGPTYKSHAVRGDTVFISFENLAGGLASRSNDGSVGAVAIAGADRKWAWAHARVVGNRLAVWSESVASPVAVRYAWTNSPVDANLYNKASLPAAPFRTDRW